MIDINCDMGEETGFDGELLPLVSSANIACGFHAGGPMTMDVTVAGATAHGVSVGAHVSYPDREGFGRRHVELGEDELTADVLVQIGALEALCRRHDTTVRYVKAHGALYNDIAADHELAAAYGRALLAWDADLQVLTLAGSPSIEVLSTLGLRVVAEAFADRAYTAAGGLVPRSEPEALVTDAEQVAGRAVAIARGEPISASDGSPLVVEARSLCVHGDTPGAAGLAAAVRRGLEEAGVEVGAFA